MKHSNKVHLDVLRRRISAPFKKERVHLISFYHAWNGIVYALKTQPNFRFHFFAAFCVIAAGFFFKVSTIEWIVIGFTIMTVLVAETVNTAIESVVDLLTDKYHLDARRAKDVSAGMVLIAVVFSVFVGLLIFVPHINNLLT
ncbi:MAG: diacylglycerol kinase family protein [Candidatus Pacebacteria bacterium]|nr:diacylglycerol kinase family protein [Candidatus Paceibacterota bacterium]